MNETEPADLVIPLVEETARIDKVIRETGRVLVSTEVTEQLQHVEADLVHETFEVERIPRNEQVSAVPPVRQEGGVLIYPVVEEVLVVEKRLILREEVRVVRAPAHRTRPAGRPRAPHAARHRAHARQGLTPTGAHRSPGQSSPLTGSLRSG